MIGRGASVYAAMTGLWIFFKKNQKSGFFFFSVKNLNLFFIIIFLNIAQVQI